MKNLVRLTLVVLMMFLCVDSYSQIGVTGYSFYALGINTSQNKPISGELKTFTNRPVDDLIFEADVFYNFKPRPYHRFSIGVGVMVGPFRGFDHIDAITVPAQLEIFPLQEFRKLSLMFELAPMFVYDNEVVLRSLLGIRYSFGELKE